MMHIKKQKKKRILSIRTRYVCIGLVYGALLLSVFGGCGNRMHWMESAEEGAQETQSKGDKEQKKTSETTAADKEANRIEETNPATLEEHTSVTNQEMEGEVSISAGESDSLYEQLLDCATKEFIGSYPVDETFLSWFEKTYGKDALEQVAGETRKESMDVNIWYEAAGESIHVLWLRFCEAMGIMDYYLENVQFKDTNRLGETTLAFSGDINFDEDYVTTRHMDAQPNGILDCFSENLLSEMKHMDVMMLNNEFTYSTRGEALAGKAYTFRANPERVSLLSVFGTDIVGIANNHVYDYGEVALLDTMNTLTQAGIPYIGAGANLQEAKKGYSFVCNGRKITIVAATQIERSLNYTKEATETQAGVLKTLNPTIFCQVIEEEKQHSDYVIVFVHWGTEGDNHYGSDQKNLALHFVSAGADAIIGGHTHCLQGFDMIDDVPIIYSLGNFWFSSETLYTGLAKVIISEDDGLNLQFLPCIQENLKTSLVTDEWQKQTILSFMQNISAPGVKVLEDGRIALDK